MPAGAALRPDPYGPNARRRCALYTLVRRFIKTGIAFLAAGVALGVWMLVRRELWGEWPHPYLVSAHAHAVLVGFVMFLILGVALWLFPRAAKHVDADPPGGEPAPRGPGGALLMPTTRGSIARAPGRMRREGATGQKGPRVRILGVSAPESLVKQG